MHDDPEPACGRVENDCAKRGSPDHNGAEKERLAKPSIWIGCEHLILAAWASSGPHRHERRLLFLTLADAPDDLKQHSQALILARSLAKLAVSWSNLA